MIGSGTVMAGFLLMMRYWKTLWARSGTAMAGFLFNDEILEDPMLEGPCCGPGLDKAEEKSFSCSGQFGVACPGAPQASYA